MPYTLRFRLLLVGVLAAGAACQPAASTVLSPVTTAPSSVTSSAIPRPAMTATAGPLPTAGLATQPAVSLTPGPSVEIALSDLAQRLGVAKSAVELIRIELADMPLPDLGCPANPGTPPPDSARVTGQVIWLKAGKDEYLYHSDGQVVVFCGLVAQPDEGGDS